MDCIQHLVPTGCGDDDLVGVGGPDKGSGLLVMIDDKAVNGGLEVDDALEDAALEAAFG